MYQTVNPNNFILNSPKKIKIPHKNGFFVSLLKNCGTTGLLCVHLGLTTKFSHDKFKHILFHNKKWDDFA